jgi:hypothetical protein
LAGVSSSLKQTVEPPSVAELERAAVDAMNAGDARLARFFMERIDARSPLGALVLPFPSRKGG